MSSESKQKITTILIEDEPENANDEVVVLYEVDAPAIPARSNRGRMRGVFYKGTLYSMAELEFVIKRENNSQNIPVTSSSEGNSVVQSLVRSGQPSSVPVAETSSSVRPIESNSVVQSLVRSGQPSSVPVAETSSSVRPIESVIRVIMSSESTEKVTTITIEDDPENANDEVVVLYEVDAPAIPARSNRGRMRGVFYKGTLYSMAELEFVIKRENNSQNIPVASSSEGKNSAEPSLVASDPSSSVPSNETPSSVRQTERCPECHQIIPAGAPRMPREPDPQ